MGRVLVPTAGFALLVFVGYLSLTDASVGTCLVKTSVIAAVFGLYRLWTVRRQVRREAEAADGS